MSRKIGYDAVNRIQSRQGSIRTGSAFELDMIGSMRTVFKDKKSVEVRSCIGDEYLDKKQGTDIVLAGKLTPTGDNIHIDATSDFRGKDSMPFVFDTGIVASPHLCFDTFKIGIRTGNTYRGYTPFKKPVVVIGIDCSAQEYDAWGEEIMDSMIKHGDQLVEAAIDAYYDYTITDKKQRKEIVGQEPLRSNPSYYSFKKRENDPYETNNQFQHTIMQSKEDADYGDY